MDTNQDIRWHQRFNNFKKAFAELEEAVKQESYNKLEKQGLIQAFEYTYELAWKTLQDILIEKGYQDIRGPRPVIEQAFQDGYIKEGKRWLAMVKNRNLTTHTYDEKTANEVVENIRTDFYFLLKELLGISQNYICSE